MKFLILGGTRFTGPYVVSSLIKMGHEVVVFHRGGTHADLPPNVTHILGDRHNLNDFAAEFKRLSPDVVIDMLAFTKEDAQSLMRVCKDITSRIVVASSIDVYRAFGRLHRTEPGPPILFL
ncbi:MAG: NAD(P)H-binding protein [Anaerolineae bacterium]|nr:NAD(P)H-binding protein [Anaerolineae bacterium]MCI0610586.1 NAD(P)H-binding protein [Anaerolineae bacterium]